MKRILIVVLFLIAGCSAKHVYEGSTRPKKDLSRIYFNAEYYGRYNGVTLSDMSVNGKPLGMFDAGAYSLPGEQTARFNFSHYMKECLYEKDKSCPIYSNQGRCRVDFPTEAGKTYKVEVRRDRDISVFVIDESNYSAVAHTVCAGRPAISVYQKTTKVTK